MPQVHYWVEQRGTIQPQVLFHFMFTTYTLITTSHQHVPKSDNHFNVSNLELHHWSERSALPQFGLSCLFSPAEALSRSLFRVKLGWPDPIQTWARQRTTVPAGTTGCCLPCVIWKLGQKGCCSGGKKRKDLSRSTPAGDKQAPTLLECYITHMNGHPVWCTNN